MPFFRIPTVCPANYVRRGGDVETDERNASGRIVAVMTESSQVGHGAENGRRIREPRSIDELPD